MEETTKTKTHKKGASPGTKQHNRKNKIWRKHNIATINIRGAKRKGAREEVEQWMKQKDISIAMIQETRIGTNSRESRNEYTWFFSGEKQHQNNYIAGVGIVVKNSILKHLIDIEPVSDRVMWATWRGTINITTINITTGCYRCVSYFQCY